MSNPSKNGAPQLTRSSSPRLRVHVSNSGSQPGGSSLGSPASHPIPFGTVTPSSRASIADHHTSQSSSQATPVQSSFTPQQTDSMPAQSVSGSISINTNPSNMNGIRVVGPRFGNVTSSMSSGGGFIGSMPAGSRLSQLGSGKPSTGLAGQSGLSSGLAVGNNTPTNTNAPKYKGLSSLSSQLKAQQTQSSTPATTPVVQVEKSEEEGSQVVFDQSALSGAQNSMDNYDVASSGHTGFSLNIVENYASEGIDEKKIAEEDAAAKKKAEEELAAKKKAEEDAATKKKAEEELAAKKKAEEQEAARVKAEEEELARVKAEEEAARIKAEEEEVARIKAEEEEATRIKAEEEEAARIKAEEEEVARIKAEEEEVARIKAEEEEAARIKAEEEELARIKAEEEAAIAAAVEDEAKAAAAAIAAEKKAEAKAKAALKKAEEEAARKKRAEEAAEKKKLEDEAKKKKQEEAAAKKKADEDARKRAAEEAAAKKRADIEAKKKEAEEAAAKKKAEDDARKKAAEEEARLKSEEEARLKAEEEARLKAEEEDISTITSIPPALTPVRKESSALSSEVLLEGDADTYTPLSAAEDEATKLSLPPPPRREVADNTAADDLFSDFDDLNVSTGMIHVDTEDTTTAPEDVSKETPLVNERSSNGRTEYASSLFREELVTTDKEIDEYHRERAAAANSVTNTSPSKPEVERDGSLMVIRSRNASVTSRSRAASRGRDEEDSVSIDDLTTDFDFGDLQVVEDHDTANTTVTSSNNQLVEDESAVDTNEEPSEESLEEESKLKYQRVGASTLKTLLASNALTALCCHDKYLMLGTKSGRLVQLDLFGNEIMSIQAHTGAVTCLSVDRSGDFVLSGGLDGQTCLLSVFTREQTKVKHDKAVLSVAINPRYKEGFHSFASGGIEGKLTISTKGWLGFKDVVIASDEGPIRCIAWADNGGLLAWANSFGVKVFDVTIPERIAFIPKPQEEDGRGKCRLTWARSDVLFIAWGSVVKVGQIKFKNLDLVEGHGKSATTPGNRYMQLISLFRSNLLITGIAPLNEFIVILGHAYTEDDDEDEDDAVGTEDLPEFLPDPEIRVVTYSNDEVCRDILPLNGYDASTESPDGLFLSYLGGLEPMFYVVSPKDIVLAKCTDIDDKISWLLQKHRFKDALDAALGNEYLLQKHDIASISLTYLRYLVSSNQYELCATQISPLLNALQTFAQDHIRVSSIVDVALVFGLKSEAKDAVNNKLVQEVLKKLEYNHGSKPDTKTVQQSITLLRLVRTQDIFRNAWHDFAVAFVEAGKGHLLFNAACLPPNSNEELMPSRDRQELTLLINKATEPLPITISYGPKISTNSNLADVQRSIVPLYKETYTMLLVACIREQDFVRLLGGLDKLPLYAFDSEIVKAELVSELQTRVGYNYLPSSNQDGGGNAQVVGALKSVLSMTSEDIKQRVRELVLSNLRSRELGVDDDSHIPGVGALVKLEWSVVQLLKALSSVLVAENRVDLALQVRVQSGSEEVFQILSETENLEFILDCLEELAYFSPKLAINLFTNNTNVIPPASVVLQFYQNPVLLQLYLYELAKSQPKQAQPYTSKLIWLQAEYAPVLLCPFLKSNKDYTLSDALQAAQQYLVYRAIVYLHLRTGDTKEAIRIQIHKLGDLKEVLVIVQEQQDKELWGEVIEEVVKTPAQQEKLQCVVGQYDINVPLLLRRIPDNTVIPDLKTKLVNILNDSRLQVTVHRSCKSIVQSDKLKIQHQYVKLRKSAVVVSDVAVGFAAMSRLDNTKDNIKAKTHKCTVCDKALYGTVRNFKTTTSEENVALFRCGHHFHGLCLAQKSGVQQQRSNSEYNVCGGGRGYVYHDDTVLQCAVCTLQSGKLE